MAPKLSTKIIVIASVLVLSVAGISSPVLAASPLESKYESSSLKDISNSTAAENLLQSNIKEMVFKFYFDPALVPDMDFAKVVLPKYIEDMNRILAKNTNRQLVFNPETDIILTDTQPHSNQALPPLPVESFEIWAYAVPTSYSVSYGGYAGIDDSGAGVLAGLKWTQIYDPEQVTLVELTDYWTQINNMLHELAHVFGAGIGEYYKLSNIQDATGVEPFLNINIYDQNDSFWSGKPDFMPDPLLKNAAQDNSAMQPFSRENLINFVKYSELTATIISNDYRNEIPTVDLSQINIEVVSADESPIDAATIKIWSVVGGSPYQTQLLVDGFTNANGGLSFAWGSLSNPHNSYDFLRLIKVYKDGYIASAKYVSIFDADIEKQVNGSDYLNITIKLIPVDVPVEPTFADVTVDNFAWPFIERLHAAGITGGCSLTPLLYCPDQIVTRGQMAVFLERSMKGSSFFPTTDQVSFNDTVNHWAGYWIEALALDGVTSGCGNGNYCPDEPVTRAQMAVFLLRAKYGAQYMPPPTSELAFQDVATNYWAAVWIEQFKNEGITSGCGNGNYCPDEPVTRAQMAVFLTKAFNLP